MCGERQGFTNRLITRHHFTPGGYIIHACLGDCILNALNSRNTA